MAAGENSLKSGCASQIDEPDSLPFSLPSQPPDIKNWFPSYYYESSVSSDASLGFEGDNENLEEQLVPFKDEDAVDSGKPLFSVENSVNECSLESKFCRSEAKKVLLFEDESKLRSSNRGQNIPHDPIVEKFITNKQENHHNNNRISNPNGLIGGSINKKRIEGVPGVQENGFISTKNRVEAKRIDQSSKVPCLAVHGRKRNRTELEEATSVFKKEQSLIERRAFADQTNALMAKEAIAEEESGKWKCPRKSKPYAGPPLKQLRLERWARRML